MRATSAAAGWAVERHGRRQLGQLGGQVVGDAAAVAEADHADLAGAAAVRPAHAKRGDEVGARLRLVQLGEQRARLVLVAGIAAQREQRVRRVGDEALQRQAARDVLDVRVQAAVLVHDQDRRQLALGVRRHRQVAAHRAVALRRRQAFGGHAGGGVFAGLVQEVAARQQAVYVLVEQLHHFRRKIVGGQAGHVVSSRRAGGIAVFPYGSAKRGALLKAG
jgi:hypothetical protein